MPFCLLRTAASAVFSGQNESAPPTLAGRVEHKLDGAREQDRKDDEIKRSPREMGRDPRSYGKHDHDWYQRKNTHNGAFGVVQAQAQQS